jgi:hypothetical protein
MLYIYKFINYLIDIDISYKLIYDMLICSYKL